jgi:hypothetical protein
MLEKSIGLLFFLKKPKNYQQGDPKDVYLKITVDGIARELSCRRKWEYKRWNPHAGRASGFKEDAKELNTYLDTLQTMAYDAKRVYGFVSRCKGRAALRRSFMNLHI